MLVTARRLRSDADGARARGAILAAVRAASRAVAGLAAASLTATPARAYTCAASMTALSFGTYNPRAPAPNDAAGSVSLRCEGTLLPGVTLLVSYTLSLSAGGGGFAPRRLASGPAGLAYQLYGDPARTQVWGDGTSGTLTRQGSWLLGVLAPPQTYTVYGRIPPGQNPPPGVYADMVVMTVTY